MNRISIFSLFFLISLFSTVELNAQVLVRASADKDSILVGDPIHITVEARLPLGQKYEWFKLDTIPHFEWLDKGVVQDTNDVDGKKISQVFTITSYDTGSWSIPSVSIRVGNQTYSSDTVPVRVVYNAGFNASEEYRDIKEPEEVEAKDPNQWKWWALGGLTLIVLVIILFFLFNKDKKHKKTQEVQVLLTPYEEAMKSIGALRLDRSIPIKEYYTALNNVLRTYLNRELGISTFEKTNDELLQQLRSVRLPASEYSSLSDALHLSDYVKFAKYEPDVDHNERAIRIIEEAINIINNSQPKKQSE